MVVRKDYKRVPRPLHVASPVLAWYDNCQHFLDPNCIMLHSRHHHAWPEGIRVPNLYSFPAWSWRCLGCMKEGLVNWLGQDPHNCRTGWLRVKLDRFVLIAVHQNRCCGRGLWEPANGVLNLGSGLEGSQELPILTTLSHVAHGLGHLLEVFDKPLVKVSKAQEHWNIGIRLCIKPNYQYGHGKDSQTCINVSLSLYLKVNIS